MAMAQYSGVRVPFTSTFLERAMPAPKKIANQIQKGSKQYTQVLKAQQARDVSEADTVTVVKDLLSDVFGYDKYAELTSEHAIRGTYCDLAVQFDGKLQLLIEVKAIGLELNDRHVKQAIDYAANQGVEWVALTNGVDWVLYRVIFQKPIDKEEVIKLSLLGVNPRNESDLEHLYLFTKSAIQRNALKEFRDKKDATSRFMVAAIILNCDSVLSTIRREVRRVSDILVDPATIEKVLREQVIKREAIEGDQANEAKQRYCRTVSRETRKKRASKSDSAEAPAEDSKTPSA